ncbi:MAG: type II secretion system F family protein [Clostridia bacterium]|nr:type II secretion system F family protein [Clostridia bacterium]
MKESSIGLFFISIILFFIVYCVSYDHTIKEKLNMVAKIQFSSISKVNLLIVCFVFYVSSGIMIFLFINNILAAFLISFIPGIIPFLIYDIIYSYLLEKEQKQVTELIMTLSKWSGVRNDLIFCFKKACESDLRNPIKKLINTAYVRINSGMNIDRALLKFEQEAFGENLRYLIKNIRFSAKKGGNLSKFFRNAEEQYFKIDEEMFKRKISSYQDQMTIYAVMVAVLVIGFWFISQDSRVYSFYLETRTGQNLIGMFCLMYCIGVYLTVKKVR